MDMQVIAGAPTQETAYRQFDAIIADLNYQLLAEMLTVLITIHHGVLDKIWVAPHNVDTKIGKETLTSTSMAFWNWDPSNDRDLQDFKFWLNHKIQPDIRS
jgi:iron complex outermembrane receptor protein